MSTKYYNLTASEFDWNISDQQTIKAWGFNNSFPGPVIKANKGDKLIIKVKNQLPEATIIHWHGVRLQASMDGTDSVQQPIPSGGEFEYRFDVPDAGSFWYHSHFNETWQVERGMYGALIVEDLADPVFDDEKVLMIDDVKLNKANEFKKGNFFERWIERHDGRQGNIVLLNGTSDPVISINAGQVERWRVINASSARYVRVYLDGRPFKIIGTDGGLLEYVHDATEVLMVPGERMDIAVGPFAKGDKFLIRSLGYNRTTFAKTKDVKIASVNVGKEKTSITSLPNKLREIAALAPHHAEINRKIKFSVGASWKHGIDFLVNGKTHHSDQPVYVNELQVWEVANTSLMDHPFHLHGFFFQVIEENGKPPAYRSWKDSYNLRPKSKIKIAWLPDDRPGEWMYHCHILEHHEAGMMGHFEVINKEKGTQRSAHHHHHHH